MSSKLQRMAKSSRGSRVEVRMKTLEENFVKLFNQLRNLDMFQRVQQNRLIKLENRLDGKEETENLEAGTPQDEQTRNVDRNGEREGQEVVGGEGTVADRETQPPDQEPITLRD